MAKPASSWVYTVVYKKVRKLICSGIEMHKEKSSYYQNKTYGEGVNAASYLRGIDDWGT